MAAEPEWQGEPCFVNLNPGPHLFVDDFLIANSINLTRTTHQPEKLPEAVISNAGGDSPVLYMKVDRDPETGFFRAWYNSIGVSGPGPSHRYEISHRYTESQDGIHWRASDAVHTPHPGLDFSLFLVDERTDTPERSVFRDLRSARDLLAAHVPSDRSGNPETEAEGLRFGTSASLKSRNTSPSERYKLAVYYAGQGMWVSHSADGINFEPYPNNPAIPTSLDDTPADSMDFKQVIADIVDGCWDPLKQEYLVGCGVGENGYRGKAPRNFESRRRCVGVASSKDFLNWERPRIIVRPDPNNGYEEFYGFKPMVRGNLYLGFLRVLHDELTALPDVPEAGIGWTELITSRDGKAWTRYQDKFIDRSPVPGAYDHAMAWFGDCVTVGDKEYIYYGGYSEGHKRGPRQMGLGFLRKNGFVSRDAGSEVGDLTTPPVIITGSSITINADVSGEIRARVTDARSQPLKGFDWQDCVPIRGDSLCHPLEWNGQLSAITGRPVRLELQMREARLYGVDVDT